MLSFSMYGYLTVFAWISECIKCLHSLTSVFTSLAFYCLLLVKLLFPLFRCFCMVWCSAATVSSRTRRKSAAGWVHSSSSSSSLAASRFLSSASWPPTGRGSGGTPSTAWSTNEQCECHKSWPWTIHVQYLDYINAITGIYLYFLLSFISLSMKIKCTHFICSSVCEYQSVLDDV